jgi:hypothetical protein
MPEQRSQYAGEGYIVSFMGTICSLVFLAITRIETLTAPGGFGRSTLLFVLIALGFLSVQIYLTCYRFKAPWYSTSFGPPQDYIRGPLMRD